MYSCPSCGGGLSYHIESGKMLCRHCSNSYLPEDFADANKIAADVRQIDGGKVYMCRSCGAELIVDRDHDIVVGCPYCGGEFMITDKYDSSLYPDRIIPFKITKEKCKDIYLNETKKSVFISKKYSDQEYVDGFCGIYMPYWCFHAKCTGMFSANVISRARNTSKTIVEDVYEISCTVSEDLKYYHDASLSFADELSERIGPFDTKDEVPFVPGYTAGFYAEINNVDSGEYYDKAKEAMTEYVGGTIVADDRVKTSFGEIQESYIDSDSIKLPMEIVEIKRKLFPVWLMRIKRGKNTIYAAVNGQTGKIATNLSFSIKRFILLACLISCFAFLPVLLLIGNRPAPETVLSVCAMLLLGGMCSFNCLWNRLLFTVLDLNPDQMKMNSSKIIPAVIDWLVLTVMLVIISLNNASKTMMLIAAVLLVAFMYLVSFSNADKMKIKRELDAEGNRRHRAGQKELVDKFAKINGTLFFFSGLTIAASVLCICLNFCSILLTLLFTVIIMTLLLSCAVLMMYYQNKLSQVLCSDLFRMKGADGHEN